VFLRTKGDEVALTWEAARERVDAIAGGLARLGLSRGDTIALLIGNRPEFALVDLGATMLGATPFSIYMQYTPEQIAFVVGDAGARILVCEQALLPGVLEAREQLPSSSTSSWSTARPPRASCRSPRSRGRTPASTWRRASRRSAARTC
jgi:long-subunit acyl-CoA synthetase (AMP-forming)